MLPPSKSTSCGQFPPPRNQWWRSHRPRGRGVGLRPPCKAWQRPAWSCPHVRDPQSQHCGYFHLNRLSRVPLLRQAWEQNSARKRIRTGTGHPTSPAKTSDAITPEEGASTCLGVCLAENLRREERFGGCMISNAMLGDRTNE